MNFLGKKNFPTVVPHFYHHLVFLCECLLTSSLFSLYFVKKKYLGKSVKQKQYTYSFWQNLNPKFFGGFFTRIDDPTRANKN